MGSIGDALSNVVGSVVAAIVMVVLAVLSFFFVVFVVGNGAALAGYTPGGDFVVLSTAIIVAATILSGVMQPE